MAVKTVRVCDVCSATIAVRALYLELRVEVRALGAVPGEGASERKTGHERPPVLELCSAECALRKFSSVMNACLPDLVPPPEEQKG